MSTDSYPKIHFYCDLHKTIGPAKSGTSLLIASAGSFAPLGESGALLNFSVSIPNTKTADPSEIPTTRTPFGSPGLSYSLLNGRYLDVEMDLSRVQVTRSESGKRKVLAKSKGFARLGSSNLQLVMNCVYDSAFDAKRLDNDPPATASSSSSSSGSQALRGSDVLIKKNDKGVYAAACASSTIPLGGTKTFRVKQEGKFEMQASVIAKGPPPKALTEWSSIGRNAWIRTAPSGDIQFRWNGATVLQPSKTFQSLLVASSGGWTLNPHHQVIFHVWRPLSDALLQRIASGLLDTISDEDLPTCSYRALTARVKRLLKMDPSAEFPAAFEHRLRYFIGKEYASRKERQEPPFE